MEHLTSMSVPLGRFGKIYSCPRGCTVTMDTGRERNSSQEGKVKMM